MDILRLLDDLNTLAVERPHRLIGLPIFVGVDLNEISVQIAKIRASLPQEVKAAASTIRESDRIIEQAKGDATTLLDNAQKEAERVVSEAKKESERILEQARIERERMVSESEILKLSKVQSEEIRNAADKVAIDLKRGADEYAHNVLVQLETFVGKYAVEIERGKQAIADMSKQEKGKPKQS